ncbi:MAG: autotransporter domain-containing protein [Akkermansia sp.]|nr:autotransporter domain-containing protein [Akkermansia sp.]
MSKWSVVPIGPAFQVGIAPDGDLFIAYNKNTGEKQIYLLSNIRNFRWTLVSEVSVMLSYNAEDEVLSLTGGSIRRSNEEDEILFGGVEDLKYNVPANFLFAELGAPAIPSFSAGGGSTLAATLITEGDTDGWRVVGEATIQTLGTPEKTFAATDDVQFWGADGVLYTTETMTYSNRTEAIPDLKNPGKGTGMGFGAAEGKVLTVTKATAAINDADGTALIDKLTIVGKGTVELQYEADNTGNLYGVSVNISDSATLKINCDGDAQLNLANGAFSSSASVVKTSAQTPSALIVDAGGVETSMGTLRNDNGALQIVNPGFVGADSLAASGVGLTGGVQVQAVSVNAGADGVIIDPLSAAWVAGDVIVNNGGDIETASVLTVGKKVLADKITVLGEGGITAAEIAANQISAAGITITTDGADSATALLGKVSVNNSAISANTIASGVNIEFDAENSGTITTGSMTSTSISVSSGTVTRNTPGAAEIVTNATSTGKISISKNALLTSGSLSADAIKLVNNYRVEAQGLKAKEVTLGSKKVLAEASTDSAIRLSSAGIQAQGALSATSVELADDVTITARELSAGSVQAGKSSYTDKVVLTNVQISDTAVTADEISADTVTLEEGYTVNKAAVSATNGTTINGRDAGVVLNNVSFTGAVKTTGKVVLNAVKFQGGDNTFGGANGDAFRVDKVDEGVANVILTGGIEGRNNLTINSMILNAEGLKFAPGEVKTYYLITPEVDASLSYEADPTNYELYIQSYVRAEINVDKQTGEVSITGWEDEASIKNEMRDTANRRATIDALDELKPSIEDDGSALSELDKYVGHVNRYSVEARKEVLDALSGASLTALADSQRRGVRDHQDNLRNRIIQMGGGTNAGLTTDWQYAGIQAWAQADGSFSTSDGSGDECGYDFNTWGATVGANMDLTANTVVGLALSASYGEIKSDGADHASGNNDARYISFYARHQKDRWVQMLILTAGWNDIDMERRVLGYSASGDTEGTTLSAYYELGYTIGLNYEYTHILQPMISVSLTSAKVDGYTEGGSLDNAALEYDGDSYIYGKVGIGARYQGVMYETVHERNAVVEARALITQDFGDTTEATKVSLGGGSMYEVSGADTSGTGFELGAGVSIPVEQHTTLYADADLTVAPDYTGFRVDLGVRYDF